MKVKVEVNQPLIIAVSHFAGADFHTLAALRQRYLDACDAGNDRLASSYEKKIQHRLVINAMARIARRGIEYAKERSRKNQT